MKSPVPSRSQQESALPQAAPVWRDRLTWIALAFVPSALLIAVTSHISTDIASAPFLWVVPLAMFLATFMGSFAAGPLFAAFPIASSFAVKGGRLANTVIFLGAWATIKVPMLLLESQFLGIRFSLLRLVITLPLIILMGLLMEKIMPKDSAN